MASDSRSSSRSSAVQGSRTGSVQIIMGASRGTARSVSLNATLP